MSWLRAFPVCGFGVVKRGWWGLSHTPARGRACRVLVCGLVNAGVVGAARTECTRSGVSVSCVGVGIVNAGVVGAARTFRTRSGVSCGVGWRCRGSESGFVVDCNVTVDNFVFCLSGLPWECPN